MGYRTVELTARMRELPVAERQRLISTSPLPLTHKIVMADRFLRNMQIVDIAAARRRSPRWVQKVISANLVFFFLDE